MKKYDYKKLPPFKGMVLQNFPFIEEDFDAITNYQLLCKVVEYLNIIAKNNDAMIDNINELNTWFDNLDVQEEINNKLDEMASDGTLESIITNVIKKQTGSLICSVAYRDCQEYINGITDESGNGITGYIQGITTTENTIIFALQNGGSKQNNTNMILLKEVNKNTGSTIRESWLELGHANSIAYNDKDKEIYVAPLFFRNNVELEYTKEIIIIDYDTFTIKDTITPNIDTDRINGISYDNKNDVLALSTINTVFIMNDFDSVNKVVNINNSTNILYNSYDVQYLYYYDNLIYQVKFFENGISVYNLNGENINNYYDFDVELQLRIGELESITIEENGDIYIASTQEVISTNSVIKLYDNTILKSNLIKNGIKRVYETGVTTGAIQYYVDSNTTNKLQVGTQLYPFKHIEQAIFAIEFQKRNTLSVINLVGNNKNYGFVLSKSNQQIQINGNNNIIYAIELQGQNIQFSNLTINNSILVNVCDGNDESNIYIHNNCDATFRNCIFTNTGDTKTSCIVSNFSNINVYSCTFNNFTNVFRMLNFTKVKGSTLTYNSCTYKYYNEANCVIDINDNNIYNSLNPNSQLSLIVPNVLQNVAFSVADSKITFTNKNIDRYLSPFEIFQALCDFTIENNAYRGTFNFNTDYQPRNHISFINAGNTIIYDIYIILTHTREMGNGEWGIQSVKCIKTDVSTGEKTNISDSITFNILRIVKI